MKSSYLMHMLLADFHSIRPKYETSQEKTLEWLVAAHEKAGSLNLKEKLWHVACKPDRIEKRGHVLPDFLHQDWEKMEIYRLHETPTGKSLTDRMEVFEKEVEEVFEQYYPENFSPPNDLIHVSCTGYASPSGAQKIVSKRDWGLKTTVTHCYHMGCYGSMPAIRMAQGFLASHPKKEKIDLVHTEICSLHTNPMQHSLDQLVSQSLFADGFMKYSFLRSSHLPHLKICNLLEEIIPDSSDAMSWRVSEWGFQMFLAKEVPVHITRYLPSYLSRLKVPLSPKTLFAIHPGGPKILLYIQKLLGLSDEQMKFSFHILKQYGNMSSATLPHIWQTILNDPAVPHLTPIVSMAFGPGLTISGAFMEKICGSSA